MDLALHGSIIAQTPWLGLLPARAGLAHYYPLDFDLAIFTQGLHALARPEAPFVTVRGMHLFGDHATFVHVLLVPLEALLGPILGPHLLPLVQSLALAASALLLFRLARDGLPLSEARLVLAAYLLYPALQHTWLEYYEPVNLAIPCLIGAYAAIREGRDGRAAAWSALALVTIESVAPSVAALGVFAAARGRRRLGAFLVLGAVAYVALLLGAVFPALAPGGYVYGERLYGDFANDLPGAIRYLSRPDHLLERLTLPENGPYLAGLLVPVALLARIPADAVVCAHYRFLPHLARRRELYMFPALGRGVPDAVVVDLERVETDASERNALARLNALCREIARTTRGTVLLACPREDDERSPLHGGDGTSPPERWHH